MKREEIRDLFTNLEYHQNRIYMPNNANLHLKI